MTKGEDTKEFQSHFNPNQEEQKLNSECNPTGGCNGIKKSDGSWDIVYCDKHNPQNWQRNEKKDAIINYVITVIIAILFVAFFGGWILHLYQIFLVIIK